MILGIVASSTSYTASGFNGNIVTSNTTSSISIIGTGDFEVNWNGDDAAAIVDITDGNGANWTNANPCP